MYQEILAQLGLNDSEILVYSLLLANGELPAYKIAEMAKISRTNTYNILSKLAGEGIVEELKQGAKTMFRPAHPSSLKDLLLFREKELLVQRNKLKSLEDTLDTYLPQMTSDYNLVLGKPGISFFEGKEGIQKVLEDSLTSTERIYTYADIEAITTHIDEINKEYVKKRDALGIKKRAILLDTPFARSYLKDYYKNVTDIKLIKKEDSPPFQTVLQIYDNKISYITLTEDNLMGVIIENPYIYTLHKYMFEYTWENTLKYAG